MDDRQQETPPEFGIGIDDLLGNPGLVTQRDNAEIRSYNIQGGEKVKQRIVEAAEAVGGEVIVINNRDDFLRACQKQPIKSVEAQIDQLEEEHPHLGSLWRAGRRIIERRKYQKPGGKR